jgi:hypothetical protein
MFEPIITNVSHSRINVTDGFDPSSPIGPVT